MPFCKERDRSSIKKEKGECTVKYVCEVCGYVYDEEAEGVKWEALPEDYECPVCGVGKEQFGKED